MTGQRPHRVLPGHRSTATKNPDWRYQKALCATVGREDYYATASEHPGRFLGRGAEALGIAGEVVTTEALERRFGHGCDPRAGRPLGRSFSTDDERAVAGFALTFSPPKTVSVLWALGDEETSAAVLAAHEAAVEVYENSGLGVRKRRNTHPRPTSPGSRPTCIAAPGSTRRPAG